MNNTKKIIAPLFFVSLSVGTLGGCTNTQVGTGIGGAAGAGLGYAVSNGSAVGTVVGTGAGALVGNAIGQRQDKRAYHYQYYNHPGYNYYYY
jgi:hypothetical protein